MSPARLLRVLATGIVLTAGLTAACSRSTDVPAASQQGLPAAAPSATAPAAAEIPFDLQPIWPFAGSDEVRAWQEAYRNGGQQPWHLDADATALGFTRDHLGFTGIDLVTSSSVEGADAWVGVGFTLPEGSGTTTAAVVHLKRYGTGDGAPWEVVGTRDVSLVLDTPRYGSPLTSPLVVGGVVTGVDESLRVRILGRDGTAGQFCCLAAGGEASRWEATVPVTTTPPGALAVVVSTGGHVADVERFAITGVVSG